MLLFIFMMFGIFLLLGITMAITPYITRKEILFGVSVSQDISEHPEISKMKQKFAIYTFGLSMLLGVPVFAFLLSNKGEDTLNLYLGIYVIAAILLYLLIAYFIYYIFHMEIKAIKETMPHQLEKEAQQKMVVFTDFRHKSLIVPNALFIGVSLLIILVTIFMPVLLYNRIPDQVPIHWGWQTADDFIEKSPRTFAVMPLIQFAVVVIMTYANYSLKMAKQKISPDNPKASIEQNRAYRYAMSKYIIMVGLGTELLLFIIQCFIVFAIRDSIYFIMIIIPFLILAIGGTLYIGVKYGQGGERYIPPEAKEVLYNHQNYDDDKYWKLGLIYFNPDDPSIWVEKRFGIGVSFNWGRWQSWAIMMGTIIIIIIMTIVPFYLI